MHTGTHTKGTGECARAHRHTKKAEAKADVHTGKKKRYRRMRTCTQALTQEVQAKVHEHTGTHIGTHTKYMGEHARAHADCIHKHLCKHTHTFVHEQTQRKALSCTHRDKCMHASSQGDDRHKHKGTRIHSKIQNPLRRAMGHAHAHACIKAGINFHHSHA